MKTMYLTGTWFFVFQIQFYCFFYLAIPIPLEENYQIDFYEYRIDWLW